MASQEHKILNLEQHVNAIKQYDKGVSCHAFAQMLNMGRATSGIVNKLRKCGEVE